MMFILILTYLLQASSAGILYPRQSETREILYLDGLWNFAPTNNTNPIRGHIERWYERNLKDVDVEVQLMAVPSSYNDIGVDSSLREQVGPVWYQRKFIVPKIWNGQKVWLRFSSVCYAAEVWVNSEWVVSHQIGHLPFEADITDIVKFGGENNITVVVDNILTQTTIPQGRLEELVSGRIKQTYPFDFFNYAGIDRSVVLYTTPTTYIADITIVTDIDGTTGVVNYDVVLDGTESASTRVTLIDQQGNSVSSNTATRGTLQVANAIFWWPYLMDPNPGYLYDFQIQLLDISGEVLDSYTQSIGIRKISWDSTSLQVNNKPVYLRGFGRHEDSDIKGKGLDLPLIVRDHNLIKWIGANSYRTSHYPYAEEILDLADQNGIMIISETSACSLDNFTDALLVNHKQAVTELVQRDKNRPSVVMWSVANEPNVSVNESIAYFDEVIQHLKSLETSRPATLTSFYSVGDEVVGHLLDIISFNIYQAWYENTGDLDVVVPIVVDKTRQWHEKYNIPVMITEYGADTQEGLHFLPSYVWSEEYQDEVMSKYFEAFDLLRAEGYFIGEHIWNFADFKTAQSVNRVGGNKKGIFTRNRQPKASAHLMRNRYWTLAQHLDNADVPDDLNHYIYQDPKTVKNEL